MNHKIHLVTQDILILPSSNTLNVISINFCQIDTRLAKYKKFYSKFMNLKIKCEASIKRIWFGHVFLWRNINDMLITIIVSPKSV